MPKPSIGGPAPLPEATDRRPRRIIRKGKLREYTGLGQSAIDEEVKAGRLKLWPLTPGGKAKGAFDDELYEWQQCLRAAAARDRS